jgi:hypothetical protein
MRLGMFTGESARAMKRLASVDAISMARFGHRCFIKITPPAAGASLKHVDRNSHGRAEDAIEEVFIGACGPCNVGAASDLSAVNRRREIRPGRWRRANVMEIEVTRAELARQKDLSTPWEVLSVRPTANFHGENVAGPPADERDAFASRHVGFSVVRGGLKHQWFVTRRQLKQTTFFVADPARSLIATWGSRTEPLIRAVNEPRGSRMLNHPRLFKQCPPRLRDFRAVGRVRHI